MLLEYLFIGSCVSAALVPVTEDNLYVTSCTGELQLYAFGNGTCAPSDSSESFCLDTRFAQSTVQCIYQMVVNVRSVPVSSQNETLNAAYTAFISNCPQYTMSDVNLYRSNGTYLTPYSNNKTGIDPGCWPVSEPFSLPDSELKNAYDATYLYYSSEKWNRYWGAGLLGYWAVVLLVKSFTHGTSRIFHHLVTKFCNHKFPKLIRQQVIIRNSRTLNEFGITRVQTLTVIIFLILVVLAAFCNLPISLSNYRWEYDNTSARSNYIGERAAVLFLSLLPLLFLFAGRNNFLQIVTGWPQGPFLLFHRWIARAVVFLILIHATSFSVYFASLNIYSHAWSETFWRWGIVGLTFASFLFVEGLRFLRRKAYDLFVALHIVGAIFFLVGGYNHMNLLGETYGLYYLYACFAIWGFDRFMRLVRVAGAGFHRTAVVEIHDDILVVTIDQPSHWRIKKRPGEYTFIHFWQRNVFWQSHPFTMIVNPANHEQLKLFCKVNEGATKLVAEHVILSDDSKTEKSIRKPTSHMCEHDSMSGMPRKEMKALLDGPYGHSYCVLSFKECLFIAGGTGITPCFSYIQSIILEQPKTVTRIHLYWAVRVRESVEIWFKDELKFLREHSSLIDVNICASNIGNKLKIPEVVEDNILNSTGSMAIMTCGPASMCFQTRETVSMTMNRTTNYIEYFEELFSW